MAYNIPFPNPNSLQNTGAITAAPKNSNKNVVFSIGKGNMKMFGLKAKERVAVYTANGAKVLSLKAWRNGSLSVPLSSLPHGVCVISTASGIKYKLYNK